jgi:Ca2+-binding EF-hand superfamily protein
MSGLKEELSERRLNMVKKSFERLDVNGSGTITVTDIDGVYDVSMNPEFLEGRKTKEEICIEFLSNFVGAS